MKKIAIDNEGWEAPKYSEEFKQEYHSRLNNIENANDADKEDIKANLLIEMQEQSFSNIRPGMTVYEYDEKELYPVVVDIIDEETCSSYQSIEFKEITDANQIGTVKQEDILICEGDEIKGDITERIDQNRVKEIEIKGSEEYVEEEIKNRAELPGETKESIALLERYANYNGATVKGFNNMTSLNEDQRDVYLTLFANTLVPLAVGEDGVKELAQNISKEDIRAIRLEIDSMKLTGSESRWKAMLEDETKSVFITSDDLKSGISKNPALIKYLNDIPQINNIQDDEHKEIEKKHLIRLAERTAESKGIDIKDIIDKVERKESESIEPNSVRNTSELPDNLNIVHNPETVFIHHCNKPENAPFSPDKVLPIDDKSGGFGNKPFGGYWGSPVNTEDNFTWTDWTNKEDFQKPTHPELATAFKVEGNFVVIQTAEDAYNLPRTQECKEMEKVLGINLQDANLTIQGIDFKAMSEQGVDGIIFMENGETHGPMYGWDCDSIVVFNAESIKEITGEERESIINQEKQYIEDNYGLTENIEEDEEEDIDYDI